VFIAWLLALLAFAAWFAVYAWTSIEGPAIPAVGYVAMGLGIVFSLAIGWALWRCCFTQAVTATTRRRNMKRPTRIRSADRKSPAQQKPTIGPYLRLPLRHDFP
jgi:hypothetical protein